MFVDKSMSKNVIVIDKEAGVLEAKDKMAEHQIRHLPVTDKENKLIGVVTDRDVRSAMPSIFVDTCDIDEEKKRIENLKVKDIMTTDIVTVSPLHTLQDAILLIQKTQVGAFPVVDDEGKLKGMISVRDLLRAFINVLGIREPGMLLCVLVENKKGQMKKIVDAITEENVSFGSILVAKYWDEGKRAVFPYLLTNHVAHIRKKLQNMGFELLNPMEWYLDQLPKTQ
ncbi:CBS and ACT domain-containing protein [Desulfonema magnum]|uniref:CBS domain-containing protein n=1 Tax=Desulfonema magnum TaxID=45655 RepID=A0A975BMZ7_9BACT|nr:CBS and ACT domain-containing protein [Desulfonema magnum]QTA88501.1 CBS domain-containing protein [Desulfonema magnum]